MIGGRVNCASCRKYELRGAGAWGECLMHRPVFEGRRKGYGAVNILLIEEDGIVTLGGSLAQAFYLADITEQNARVAYISSKLWNEAISRS